MTESLDDVGYEGLDLSLGFGREVTLGVDLADGVAEESIDQVDAALPAWALLGSAGEGFAEEGEALVGEGFGQGGGVALEQVEGEPVFPGVERILSD